MVSMAAGRRNPGQKVFLGAALIGGVAVAVFLAEVKLRIGGEAMVVAVMDIGEALFALTAAAACAYAAGRSSGRLRSAWILFAASAFSWGLGGTAWSISEVGFGISPTSPWLTDIGYLVAYPFAVAGILALPLASNAADRWRSVLDGGIVAGSLICVAWTLGLSSVFGDSPLDGLGRVITVAYPVLDIVLVTLLALAARRSGGRLRVTVVLLLAGFLANLAADTHYAYGSLAGSYGTLGSMSDTGWVIGYSLIALAALWPVSARPAESRDNPVSPWQLALPWLGVVVVMASAVWASATQHPFGTTGTGVAVAVGVLFVTSQALLIRDSIRLINLSRLAEAQLKERSTLLREVISRAPLGIARIDMNMRLVDVNPRLGVLLAAPEVLLLNSRVMDYLPPDQLAGQVDNFAALLDGTAESIEGETEVRRMDGTNTWLRWTVTAVRRANGKVDYFLAMFEDFTARHEIERAALANLEASERLNRLKSEFLSMVSHEFRTALTGIQGYSEILSTQDVTPEEVKEFSGDINADSLRLNRMITEMLDLDRIESGRISMNVAPLDLNQVLREQTERVQLTTTKHTLKTELDSTVALVDGDSDRIVQVVANLLSNAIKYSPQGGEIVVRSRAVDGNVEVSVRDHGQGIPSEFLRKIFGRYERYEASGKNQVVGTGLGLAIAQQIIQLHKGRIWVDSEVGKGSEFHFTIPVASVNATGSTADPGTVALPAQKVA